jgi:hypothetical protein
MASWSELEAEAPELVALKARDLQRDPRFALHGGPADPDAGWDGDAKLSGHAEELTDRERR